MLGEIKLVPAILFYLLYVGGIVIFVSGAQGATWQSTLLYGALFGLFCYATFELTSMSLLKHWSWPVVIVDISWGAFVTAVSSTAGLLVANWVVAKSLSRHSGMERSDQTRNLRDPGFDASRRPDASMTRCNDAHRHFGCGTIRM